MVDTHLSIVQDIMAEKRHVGNPQILTAVQREHCFRAGTRKALASFKKTPGKPSLRDSYMK